MLANYDIWNTKYPRLSLLCEFLVRLFVSSSKYVFARRSDPAFVFVDESGGSALTLAFSSPRLQ